MNIIETNWKWASGLSIRSSTQYIALHHAAAKTCTAAQIDQWHKGNGWSGIGYHFFVRKDGSIYRGRPVNTVGAHVSGMNSISVGVCAEGDYSNETVMPASQKNSIKEVIAYLKGLYPSAKIVGHFEIGQSACPGNYYPLSEMKNVTASYQATVSSQTTHWGKEFLDKLVAKGIITNTDIWSRYEDAVSKSQVVALIDKLTGGTWTSEESYGEHWVQPHVISLAGKGIITDVNQFLTNPDIEISRALLMGLIDKATNGILPKYIGRQTDHWGRNHLDSLCDKAIITTPSAWTNFEGQATRAQTMALVCKAFKI